MGLLAQFIRFVLTAVPVIVIAGCSPPPLQTDGARGIEIIPLKTYGILQSSIMLRLAGISGIDVSNAVDCYRIVYESSDENGRQIQLSGMLALPRGTTARGLVSFQHGTTSDRNEVPSNLDTDGLAAAIVFGGNGYAAIAPDYVGLGVSKRPQPYFVAADTARAVVDMLHAVRHIRGVPASPPFLAGFSEGGYASLAAQRALEAAGESVLATAAVAGAFNLRSISIPWTLKGASPQASVYLALWVRGYATRYDHPLVTVFTPQYAALVPKLIDTPNAPDEVRTALPRNPRGLFRTEVLDAIAGRGHHWLVDALTQNEMGDWAAKAPIRLYYGSKDVDVLPEEATVTARQMSAKGSTIHAVSVGGVDHNQSILAAAPYILEWLRSFPAVPEAASTGATPLPPVFGKLRAAHPSPP